MDSSNMSPTTAHELTVFIQNTFQQLQDKLNNTEDAIVSRMNSTSKKIDQIEKSLVELMDHAGVSEPFEDGRSESEISDSYKDEEEWRFVSWVENVASPRGFTALLRSCQRWLESSKDTNLFECLYYSFIGIFWSTF